MQQIQAILTAFLLIMIIHYVIHQEWTNKYQNINTFQVSAIDLKLLS